MSGLYYLSHYIKNIEGNDYYCVKVLDLKNSQIFTFYHKTDEKAKNFINNIKVFQDVSDRLTFVIKRNNKISFDLK